MSACSLDGTLRNGEQLKGEPPLKMSIVLWGELAWITGFAEDDHPLENKNGFALFTGRWVKTTPRS